MVYARENTMAYTVKQVAAMSGVSVRTLHFYDETGAAEARLHEANGYRIYEEPQLLMLQQILFYRELGFELKRIKRNPGPGEISKKSPRSSRIGRFWKRTSRGRAR